MVNLIKSFWFLFLDILFPPWCLTCDATLIRSEKGICLTCLQNIFSEDLLIQAECCLTSSAKGLIFFEKIKKAPSYHALLEASFLIYLLNQELTPKTLIIYQDKIFKLFKHLRSVARFESMPLMCSIKDKNIILLALDDKQVQVFQAYCECSCVKSFKVCYIKKE